MKTASTSKALVPINSTRPAVDTPSAPAYQSQTTDYPAPLPSIKPRGGGKKLPTKPTMSPDDMVKAVAVAAGARIASPSDAASLLKAAQAKNLVHIMPGGGSLNKPPVLSNSLPPNVHFIRTSHLPLPPSTSRPTQQVQNNSSKPASQTAQIHPSRAAAPESHRSAELTVAVPPSSASETKVKASSNSTGSCNPSKEQQVKEDQATAVAVSAPSKNVGEGERDMTTDAVPDVEMAEAQNEQIQEQSAAAAGDSHGGETIDPAQEGQIALASPEKTAVKHQNDGGSSSQEAAAGNEESADTIMTEAVVEANEEPKCD